MVSVPRLRLFLLGLAVVIVAVAAFFFFARGLVFDIGDVTLRISSPTELDVGAETEVYVTLANSTRRSLNSGRITLEAEDGIEVTGGQDTTFATLETRRQATAKFHIRAAGSAGDSVTLKARARFVPGTFSAVLEKSTEMTVRLREIPLDISFSFPSDISPGQLFTFFVRIASRAEAPIGPVGVVLQEPETFRRDRAYPLPTADLPDLWDFGTVQGGAHEEIVITGAFPQDVSGDAFVARVGILDASRQSLASYREAKEFLNLQAGSVPVDILFGDAENPRETIIVPGETVSLRLRYRNALSTPVDDVSVLLAMAHDSLDQRTASSSENFTRSVSGEYEWEPDQVLNLRTLDPGESGEITFSIHLDSSIPMRSLDDAHQAITVRARTLSGGQVLGERQTLAKILGKLSMDAEVKYYDTPEGRNRGPQPPIVGQETTYTVTLTVAGGTNGMKDVVSHVILGQRASYDALIEPQDVQLAYNPDTRDITWTISDMPPGTGILSPPRALSFRIVVKPQQEDIGKRLDLVVIASVSGEDIFTGRILDAQDGQIDTRLPDDLAASNGQGYVSP